MSRDAKVSSTEKVPFLEEWRARRERIRLRSSSSLVGSRSTDPNPPHHEGDLQAQPQVQDRDLGGGKPSEVPCKTPCPGDTENEGQDSVTLKTKEKKGSTQNKHRTKIEKRKLREKRRPTGVVNMTPPEVPDENQDHLNVNEGHREQGAGIPNQELRKLQGTYANRRTDTGPDNPGQAPDKKESNQKARQSWLEDLQKAVRAKRQDNHRLGAQLSDRDRALLQLQKEVKTLTQRLRRAEDENKRLKEENQMLLKLMGQLSC